MIPRPSSQNEACEMPAESDSSTGSQASPVVTNPRPAAVMSSRFRLAAVYSSSKWRRHLEGIADELEKDSDLKKAIDHRSLPVELKSLLEGSLSSADPAMFLVQVLRERESVQTEWRNLTQSFIYPGFVVVFAMMVAWMFCHFSALLGASINDSTQQLIGSKISKSQTLLQDFGGMIVNIGTIFGWILLTILIIRWIGPRWTRIAFLGGLPYVGRPLRWIYLVDILTRIRVFVADGMNLNEATQATFRSLESTGLAPYVRSLEVKLDSGMALGHALKQSSLCDSLIGPSFGLLDSSNGLIVERLDRALYLLKELIIQRCRGMIAVVPMLSLLFAGSVVWGAMTLYYAATFQILSEFISEISGGGPGRARNAPDELVVFQSHWLALLPIGIFGWVIMQLMIAENPQFRKSWICLAMRIGVVMTIGFAIVGIGFRFHLLGLFWTILAILTLFVLWVKKRELQRAAIAISIAATADNQHDMKLMACAFENENYGFLRSRAQKFIRLLAGSSDWYDAFERSGLVRGVTKRFSLRLLAKHPKLTNMRGLALGENSLALELDRQIWQLLVGSLGFIVVPSFLCIFQVHFIMPMMNRLVTEMEMPLDQSEIFSTVSTISSYPVWIIGPLIVIAYLFLLWIYFFPHVTRWWSIEWFFRPYFRSWTLLGLGDLVAVQPQLSIAVDEAAASHPVEGLRQRLQQVSNQLSQGISADVAMLRSKLVNRKEAALLSIARDQPTLSWALTSIGENSMQKCLQRYLLLVHLLFFVSIATFAFVVAVFAANFFEIQSLIIQNFVDSNY